MQTDPLKRVAALFMAFIFLLGYIPAYAQQDGGSDGKVIVESKSAAPGEEVTVSVSLADVPDIAGFEFLIGYNAETMTLTASEAKNPTNVQVGKKLTANPYKVSWMSAGQENANANGVICELTFQVNQNATGSSTISVSYNTGTVFYTTPDEKTLDVKPQPVNGVITIQSPVNKFPVTVDGCSLTDPPTDHLYAPDATVKVKANDTPAGQVFKGWTSEDITIPAEDAAKPELTFTMPAKAVTVKAEFVPDTTPHKVTVEGGVLVDPPADNLYAPDATVKVKANDAPAGQIFKGWTSEDITIPAEDATKPELTFTMPAKDVTVKAEFAPVDKFKVTVENGSLTDPPADNLYSPGDTVKIKADNPPSGQIFDKWIWTGSDSLKFLTGSAQDTEASFQMPNSDVNLTADYIGGCYVATAVYGSYDCPEVWTLRRFRDRILGKTWYGRLFIRLYYAVSPTVVRLFGNAQWFQNFWRGKLDGMVSHLQENGFESTPYRDQPW